MELDINSLKELKDFIPFGSAMFGAITGGIITYKIAKAKENKEALQKKVESILELDARLRHIQNELIGFKDKVLKLREKINFIQTSDREKFYKEFEKYFYEHIIEKREILFLLAIHINEKMFINTRVIYNDILFVFGTSRKGEFRGDVVKDFEQYLELVIDTMGKVKLKIDKLMVNLRANELKYTNLYLKKYIKDISN
ncbi:hypothetical protein [Bacillus pretiosus]